MKKSTTFAGFYSIEKVSKLGWLKVAGFIAALFISGSFFAINDATNGFVLIGIALVTLAFRTSFTP